MSKFSKQQWKKRQLCLSSHLFAGELNECYFNKEKNNWCWFRKLTSSIWFSIQEHVDDNPKNKNPTIMTNQPISSWLRSAILFPFYTLSSEIYLFIHLCSFYYSSISRQGKRMGRKKHMLHNISTGKWKCCVFSCLVYTFTRDAIFSKPKPTKENGSHTQNR